MIALIVKMNLTTNTVSDHWKAGSARTRVSSLSKNRSLVMGVPSTYRGFFTAHSTYT